MAKGGRRKRTGWRPEMDKTSLELLLGGIGATMISNKATAKSSSLPVKCPTLKEVNKVARKL